MLEMMPGSIIDKTNNNLNNLACTHSTIEQKTDSGEEKMTDVTNMVKNSTVPSTLDEKLYKHNLERSGTSTECSIITSELSDTLQNTNTCIVNKNVFESNLELPKAADCHVSKINVALQTTSDCDIILQTKTENSIILQESLTNRVDTQEKMFCRNSFESNCSTQSDIIYLNKESNTLSEISENKVFPQEMTIPCNVTDAKIENSEISSSVTLENVCDNIISPTISEDDVSSKEQPEKSINENVSKCIEIVPVIEIHDKFQETCCNQLATTSVGEDKIELANISSEVLHEISEQETENRMHKESADNIFTSIRLQDDVPSLKVLNKLKSSISIVEVPNEEANSTSLVTLEKNNVTENITITTEKNIDSIEIFEEKLNINNVIISKKMDEFKETIVDSMKISENNDTKEEKLELNTDENEVIFEEKPVTFPAVESSNTHINIHCDATSESNNSPESVTVCQETESNIICDSEIFEQEKPLPSSIKYNAESCNSSENMINDEKLEINISHVVPCEDETIFEDVIVTSTTSENNDSPNIPESNKKLIVENIEKEVFDDKSSITLDENTENNVNKDKTECKYTVDISDNEVVLEENSTSSLNILSSLNTPASPKEKIEAIDISEHELFENDINKGKTEYTTDGSAENEVILEEKIVSSIEHIIDSPKTSNCIEENLELENSTENVICEKKSSTAVENFLDSSEYGNLNKDECKNSIYNTATSENEPDENFTFSIKDVESSKTSEFKEENLIFKNSIENEVFTEKSLTAFENIFNSSEYNNCTAVNEAVLKDKSASPIKSVVDLLNILEDNDEENIYSIKKSETGIIIEDKSEKNDLVQNIPESKDSCTDILDNHTISQIEVGQEKIENEINSLATLDVDLHTNNITEDILDCNNILKESSDSIVSLEISQNENTLPENKAISQIEESVEKITNNINGCSKSEIVQKLDCNNSLGTSACVGLKETSEEESNITIFQELLKCVSSTEEIIDQKLSCQEKDTEESDKMSPNNDVVNILEDNSTKELLDNTESKVKNNKEKKLSQFLQKHNIKIRNLLPKLKHIKRQTKEKRTSGVLSLKLNRFYFKSNKPKWSKQIIAENKKKIKNWYREERKKVKPAQNILKCNSSSESDNEQDEVVTSCKGSEDVRNKIKQQLELLRQQRKPVVNSVENNLDTRSPKQLEKVIEVTKDTISEIGTENHSKLVSANLDDVVLSKGDGGLSIVSVVGGYISDEDVQQQQNVSETFVEKDNGISVVQLNPLNKGVSITDILLRRELHSNNLMDAHIIKPSKTNDITKIKGWRTKQFAAIPVSNNVDTENKLLEKQDKCEESILKQKVSENQASNTIENPLPSTSFGYCNSTEKNIPQIETDSKSDNILKQGETTDLENNTKSAFVSDMLDTFLSNHAQLKISYEVPKLVAEEAITKPISEMPVGNNEYLTVVNKTSYRKKIISGKVLKPKTLAEKRRMMEQDRQNQLLQSMESNENVYLKKLEYCEKKNKTEVVKDILDTMMDEKVPISRHCWNIATKFDENARQFIIVNGNKIRILGSAGGKDIIMPNEVTRVVPVKESCPPLLFSRKRKIFYKPGPLSKKHKLMIGENSENWECRVLKMPKIKLIVCPEQGKRLPLLAEQYIQLYRGEKGLISDELAKFAVSAVRSQEEVKKKYEFEIPYQNAQEKLLIRRKRLPNKTQDKINKPEDTDISSLPLPRVEFQNINVDKCIKNIMSDMLTCIENRDLDKEILKDDPDENTIIIKEEKNTDRPPSPIDPRVQAIIKRGNTRKSKTTLELRRLNVQVIEVDVKEDENESQVCMKDFCKLGCICKSIRGSRSLVPEHCGRESCMLQCNCSFGNSQRGHHSITLPAGTDLFSASTVVRLQDEVQKNLAKEEREFAQTVIKANNQTIMVGGGARERQRRIPKVPKKYSNFVSKQKGFSYEKMISVGLLEEDEDFETQMGKAAIQRAKDAAKKDTEQRVLEVELKKSVPIWNKADKISNKESQEIRNCHIKLTKLSLTNIVPWCMVHNLYKCHCEGRALFEPSATAKPRDESVANAAEYNEYISYASRGPGRYFPENNTTVTVTDNTDKYCARTRALATNFYQARNKSQRFKAQFAKIRKEGENQPVYFDTTKSSEDEVKNINVGGPEPKIRKLKTKRYLRQIEPRVENNCSDRQELLIPKHNKKITLVNVEDILNTSNKEESPKPAPATNPCQVVSAASFIDYDRSFLALLTPSSEWLDRFHKMLNLNLNTVIRQIRLLEWATLVRRHSGGVLQLWFNSKKYNNIILTEDKRRPSKHHINIKLFETTPPMANYKLPEIITSLFNNKLPGVAKKDTETYVILVYNGIFWEARGTIVLNDTYEMCLQKLGHKPTPGNILDPNLTYIQNDKPVQSKSVSTNSNIVIRSTSSVSVEVVPRNAATLVNNKQVEYSGLEITKIPPTQSVETPMKQNGSILAPLPTGFGLNRWFMLILKNDFSVLRISFSNFHIKYTHLMTAIQTARKNQKTVRIRSQEKHIDNPNNFGVYAIPGFGDRIFFGPYDNESSHGLETFRYVNGKLVNTKIYNKMRGNIEKNTTGIWYFHSSTLQNNLILEPQNDNRSSGSDCSTEMTSAEKAVKPQIEFVDLTENDSDNEKDQNEKQAVNVDPLFNVLAADFSKKVSGDITIEPVYDNAPRPPPVVKEINDIVIQPIRNDNTSITPTANVKTETVIKEQVRKTSRKRRSAGNLLIEPPNKQPTLIDSIDLDEDDGSLLKKKSTSPKRRSVDTNSAKQMPALCPINSLQTLNNEVLRKRKIIYVITNIPGIGYFEIFLTEKRSMRLNINGKANMFPTISTALTWLHQLFRRFIFFIPSNLKVKFSILESTEVPDMPKFNEEFLNGFHIMSAKGIFDLGRLSTDDMDNLGFNDQETSTILAHKCELLIERNIRILGNCMMGPEEARKLDKARILQIAPKKIELLESRESFLLEEKTRLQNEQTNLMDKLNSMTENLPEQLKKMYLDKVNSILNLRPVQFVPDQDLGESSKDDSSRSASGVLPGGKFCKIIDGKMFVMDATPQLMSTVQSPVIYNMQSLRTIAPKPQYEMIVPIAGLQSPVTLIGVPPQQAPATSILLSNNRKNSQPQRVVDLTDD